MAEGGSRQQGRTPIPQVHSVESTALVPQSLPLSLWVLVIAPNTIPAVSPPGMTPVQVGGPGTPLKYGEKRAEGLTWWGQGQGGRRSVIRSSGATWEQ